MRLDDVVDRWVEDTEKGLLDLLEKAVPPVLIFILGVIAGYAWRMAQGF
ncbi:MAG: hypothetical protein ACE5IH_08480 [Thermodesulfobacteriota bacterium]